MKQRWIFLKYGIFPARNIFTFLLSVNLPIPLLLLMTKKEQAYWMISMRKTIRTVRAAMTMNPIMRRLIPYAIMLVLAACAQTEKPGDADSLYTASSITSSDSFPAFSDSAKLDSIELMEAAE